MLLLAAVTVYLHWPRPPAGPTQLLRQGTVGGTGWSVLGQRAGSGDACLQVRVAGARRALMCDQHWDRDVQQLSRAAGGPPSLLVVRFQGTEQVLVVSVLYREIATLRAPDGDRAVLHTAPLFDTGMAYVADVLAADDAAALQAFAADGEPLFYQYVPCGPALSAGTAGSRCGRG